MVLSKARVVHDFSIRGQNEFATSFLVSLEKPFDFKSSIPISQWEQLEQLENSIFKNSEKPKRKGLSFFHIEAGVPEESWLKSYLEHARVHTLCLRN